MKGVIFTEFIEFADKQFGARIVETAIIESQLPSGGAYTAVGTYKTAELVTILGKLSIAAQISVEQLLTGFGKHLFRALAARYAGMVLHYGDAFSLLESIESVIHAEVLKLYPDAELPNFSHERLSPDELVLIYRSERGLGKLVDGLLDGCFTNYGEQVEVEREDLSGGKGTQVRFLLRRRQPGP
jgi:hypothetical protein